MKNKLVVTASLMALAALTFLLIAAFGNSALALQTQQTPDKPLLYPALPSKPPFVTLDKDKVFYRLSLRRTFFRKGEPIVMELLVENRARDDIMFEIGSPRFNVHRGGEAIWSWPAVSRMTAPPTLEYFGRGLTKIYRVSWDQKALDKKEIARGEYTLTATFPALPKARGKDGERAKPTELKMTFNIEDRGKPNMGTTKPTAPQGEIKAVLTADKTSYSTGEPIELQLVVTNNTSQPAIFRNGNSQRFEFVARAGRKEVWHWSRSRAFAMMVSQWDIQPGKSITYQATWDQKNDSDRQVPAGEYTLEGWQIGGGNAQVKVTIR